MNYSFDKKPKCIAKFLYSFSLSDKFSPKIFHVSPITSLSEFFFHLLFHFPTYYHVYLPWYYNHFLLLHFAPGAKDLSTRHCSNVGISNWRSHTSKQLWHSRAKVNVYSKPKPRGWNASLQRRPDISSDERKFRLVYSRYSPSHSKESPEAWDVQCGNKVMTPFKFLFKKRLKRQVAVQSKRQVK